MSDALSVLGFVGGAVVVDWLFATRIGDNFGDFDYLYWPFSRSRWIGVAAVIAGASYMWMIAGANGPLSSLIPLGILIVIYVVTVFADANAQRRAGYKKPDAPRYSDSDHGSRL